MIQREQKIKEIKVLIDIFPVVAILGARQCGKTTIAKQMSYDHFFDLENPQDLEALDNPQLTLEKLKGVIVIDEIQRKPEIFPLLRYLVDNFSEQKYIILGSASRDLIKQSSETLAGRIGYCNLGGFNLLEVGVGKSDELWQRGSFPRAFLQEKEKDSYIWRQNYIKTFLERDIPQLGISIPSETLRRFWIMISHFHGQEINFSEISRSFGVSDMTVRKYLDILEGAFMIRKLQPWYNNTKKRLVKSPKLYIRDSGVFHVLQRIENKKDLICHPKLGASWEGFVLDQIMSFNVREQESMFFWKIHAGAELDLFWQKGGYNFGIEIKYSDAPTKTKSMYRAINELDLTHLWVVYPGEKQYALDPKITVLPLKSISNIQEKI